MDNNQGLTSKDEIAKIAKAEDAAGVVDQQSAGALVSQPDPQTAPEEEAAPPSPDNTINVP